MRWRRESLEEEARKRDYSRTMTRCFLSVVLVYLFLVPTYGLLTCRGKFAGHRKFTLSDFRNHAASDDLSLNEPIDDKFYDFVVFENSMRKSKRPVGDAEFTLRRPKHLEVPQQVTDLLAGTDFTFDAESDDNKLFIDSAISTLEDITKRTSHLRRPRFSDGQLEKIKLEREARRAALPMAVRTMVTAIYHEKCITPAAAALARPSLYNEYCDWVAQVDAALKDEGRSAIALAKNVTAHEWLRSPPDSRNVYIEQMLELVPFALRSKPTQYILDEAVTDVSKPPKHPAAPFTSGDVTTTPSITLWDKPRGALLTSADCPSAPISLAKLSVDAPALSETQHATWVFRVDDVDLCVANMGNDEFSDYL